MCLKTLLQEDSFRWSSVGRKQKPATVIDPTTSSAAHIRCGDAAVDSPSESADAQRESRREYQILQQPEFREVAGKVSPGRPGRLRTVRRARR